MSTSKKLAIWVFLASVAMAVAYLLARFIDDDVSFALLVTLGALGTLLNATSFQVLRRFDDPPTKGMTPAFAERLKRTYERRRKTFRWKWGLAILSGLLTATCGTLSKLERYSMIQQDLAWIGYFCLLSCLLAGTLIVREYWVFTRIAREMPEHLEEERRKLELLQQLRPSAH